MDNIGILNGKAGMSVTLFEASRHLKDDCIEEHAFQVLQSILTERTGNISTGNGIAGTGWTLAYLIRHEFINADYDELFKDRHAFILRTILKDSFVIQDEEEYIRLLLFLHDVRVHDLSRQQTMAIDKLWKMAENYFRIVSAAVENKTDCDPFFYFSTGILLLASRKLQTEGPARMANSLVGTAESLWKKGGICEHPGFAFALWKYGKQMQDRTITDRGQMYMESILHNTIPGVSSLKQLADTLVFSGIMMQSSGLADKTAHFLLQFPEERLKCSIGRQVDYPGVRHGVARLLLADIYLEKTESAVPEILCLTL